MSTNSSVSIGEFKVQVIQRKKQHVNDNRPRRNSISLSFEEFEQSSIEYLEPLILKHPSPQGPYRLNKETTKLEISKNCIEIPVETVASNFSMSHKSLSLLQEAEAAMALKAYTMKLDAVRNKSIDTPRQSEKRRKSLNFYLPVSDQKQIACIFKL